MLVQRHLVRALLGHHIHLVQQPTVGRKVDFARIERVFGAVESDVFILCDKAHILHFKDITAFFEVEGKMPRRLGDAARHKSGIGECTSPHCGIFHRMPCGFVKHAAFHRNGGVRDLDTEQQCQNKKDAFLHIKLLLVEGAKIDFFRQLAFGFMR